MFAKSEDKPVEDGGEEDKRKERGGEFVIASGEMAMAFDSAKEVFDEVPEAIKTTGEGREPPQLRRRETQVAAPSVVDRLVNLSASDQIIFLATSIAAPPSSSGLFSSPLDFLLLLLFKTDFENTP